VRLVVGHDVPMASWAVEQIPHVSDLDAIGPFAAVGVEDRGELVAACIYHRWVPEYASCELTFAAQSPRWATRGTIKAILAVPFEQFGCFSVGAVIPHTHERARKFVRGIGFTQEGVRRHGFGPKSHAVLYSMTRPEYERLFRRVH
jgi:RimJ/RimL family protein N-acetyltransferase